MNSSSDSDVDRIGTLDSTCQEYHIYGPPGTGKTWHSSRQIARAAEKYGPESVLVTSFSRTAAETLAGRQLPIPRQHVGTLHSHCYRALGGPVIAETKVDDWNTQHPEWAITKKGSSAVEDGALSDTEKTAGTGGDAMLNQLGMHRNRMVPRDLWNANLVFFANTWNEWKTSNGYLDFCDLIDTCYRDVAIAPNSPRVIFVDEAQDMTALQMALIRKWGRYAEYFVVAGDDDQCIFSFSGATPEAMTGAHIPARNKIFLRQSTRVPRIVQAASLRMIRHVQSRQEKEYRPKEDEGVYGTMDCTFKLGLDRLITAVDYRVSRGLEVMIIASCGYMLEDIVASLREAKIPYANKYARDRHNWNPLTPATGVATASRILALLRPHPEYGIGGGEHWYGRHIKLWADWLKTDGCLRRGVKQQIAAFRDDAVVTMEHLVGWFHKEALHKMLAAFDANYRELLLWWADSIVAGKQHAAAFPMQIALRDVGLLKKEPLVTVGTIHSVKGGEADCVFLFPDLSRVGTEQFYSPATHGYVWRDQIIRLMYVGMTRAKRELLLCHPQTSLAVDRSFFQ